MAALDHGSAQNSSLSLPAGDRLRDVLVVTVRKSFWASPESFAREIEALCVEVLEERERR